MLEEIINNITEDTIILLGTDFVDVNANNVIGEFITNTVYDVAKMYPKGDTELAIIVSIVEGWYDGKRYIEERNYQYISDDYLNTFDLEKSDTIDYKMLLRKEKLKLLLYGRIA